MAILNLHALEEMKQGNTGNFRELNVIYFSNSTQIVKLVY